MRGWKGSEWRWKLRPARSVWSKANLATLPFDKNFAQKEPNFQTPRFSNIHTKIDKNTNFQEICLRPLCKKKQTIFGCDTNKRGLIQDLKRVHSGAEVNKVKFTTIFPWWGQFGALWPKHHVQRRCYIASEWKFFGKVFVQGRGAVGL